MTATLRINELERPSLRAGGVRSIEPVRPARQQPAGRVGRARPSAATYRRRRAFVGIISAVVVAVGLVAIHDVLVGSGGDPASAAAGLPARRSVVAHPGDSLWTIAEAHHGDVPVTRYVDALVDLNGGASIEAGQRVELP